MVVAGLLLTAAGLWFAGRQEFYRPRGRFGHPDTSKIDPSLPTGPFGTSAAIVPPKEIYSGSPKDGIPALTDPDVLSLENAGFLNDADRVAGVSLGEESRAYPLRILNQHEIVNDKLGGQAIAVTYCPLCDSVAVFDRQSENGVREFGVSGLLYNSNALMYDRGGQPEGLWSQVGALGIVGPGARTSLKALPVDLTTWMDWRTRHPETTVLSDQTGHVKVYPSNRFQTYFDSPNLNFPAQPEDDRFPKKTPILGIWVEGKARAYPLSVFGEQDTSLKQELDGKQFNLVYDAQHKSLRVEQADEDLQWMYSFWFAWYAFRPETEVYGSSL